MRLRLRYPSDESAESDGWIEELADDQATAVLKGPGAGKSAVAICNAGGFVATWPVDEELVSKGAPADRVCGTDSWCHARNGALPIGHLAR